MVNEHHRGVAQLAARHVRDVEVGSSSLLTPTVNGNAVALASYDVFLSLCPGAVTFQGKLTVAELRANAARGSKPEPGTFSTEL